MVNHVNSILPSLNKPAPEKDKKKAHYAPVDGSCKEPEKRPENTMQCKPEEDDVFGGLAELTDEEKELLDALYKMNEESKNPPFVVSTEESKQQKKAMDEFDVATKRSNLKMLVRAAQMRSPHQYTGSSWQNLRSHMKTAMRIAGSAKASPAALNKALNHMRNGLTGLRYKFKKPEYSNLRKPLPMERNAQKPKMAKDIFGEKQPKVFDWQSKPGDVTTQNPQQAPPETGANVDVSCSDTSTATAAVAESAESVDVQA